MTQICQIHVEFHVAFVRFETKRNVVQDMTCMVSFDSIFHQECIYCGLWDQKQRFRTQIHRFQWGYQSSRGCQSQDTPTIDPWILYFFDPQNAVFAMYDENMVQKCIPRLPTWNSASNDVFGWWLAPDWKSRDLSRDIWQDPRVYVESMNHGCHVGKISQDMTE